MSRAVVLISPAARRGGAPDFRVKLAAEIGRAIEERGLVPDFPEVHSAAEAAAALGAAARDGVPLAVVAGGDGSVRLAVDQLAGSKTQVGIVPLGTGNLLAAALGILREPFAAAARLADAGSIVIDTGRLESGDVSEGFAVAAGLGFDARVMAATSSAAKARFGILAYFATVLRLLSSLPAARTEIVVDGRSLELSTVAVLIANCGQILPGLIGPRTPIDPTDGLLDVIAIRSGSLPIGVATAARSGLNSLIRAGLSDSGSSLRLRGSRISVVTTPPEPVQVDGDLLELSTGSFSASVLPASLSVLV